MIYFDSTNRLCAEGIPNDIEPYALINVMQKINEKYPMPYDTLRNVMRRLVVKYDGKDLAYLSYSKQYKSVFIIQPEHQQSFIDEIFEEILIYKLTGGKYGKT